MRKGREYSWTMGSDAELFLFDHERLRTTVAPTMRALLVGQDVPEWLAALRVSEFRESPELREKQERDLEALSEHFRARPLDLTRDCGALGDDLAWLGTWEPGFWSTPEQYLCREESCAAAALCPYQQRSLASLREELAMLFEEAVSTCISEPVFLGRNLGAHHYLQHVPSGPLAARWRASLLPLETRGVLLGQSGGVGEGVHGWLDVAEAQSLAELIAEVGVPEQAEEKEDFLGWSLDRFRDKVDEAAEAGLGVLWGHDLRVAGGWSRPT